MKKNIFYIGILFSCVLFISGCTVVFQKGRRSDVEKIQYLEKELADLKGTRDILEERLSQEIKDKQVSVSMEERGLVITFVAEVLFDSGKAELKEESLSILDKVIPVLKDEALEHQISIEGHTDNVPITHSKWKSNWELSSHRSLSVLYYIEENGVDAVRLSAAGYGEYHPVESNDTEEGKQKNRRVEIVILPKTMKKVDENTPSEPETDLK